MWARESNRPSARTPMLGRDAPRAALERLPVSRCCSTPAAAPEELQRLRAAGWNASGVDTRCSRATCSRNRCSPTRSNWIRRASDAVHASPPCADHSNRRTLHAEHGTGWMLGAMRELAERRGAVGDRERAAAPMRPDYVLCGCMSALACAASGGPRPRRGFDLNPAHDHRCDAVTLYAHGASTRRAEYVPLVHARAAMPRP